MKQVCKMECTRVLQSKSFRITIILVLILVAVDSASSCYLLRDSGKYMYPDFFLSGWLPMDFQFVYGSLFRVMLPLIAAIPHSATYYDDRKSGYIKNICLKVPKRDYFKGKYLVTFFTGTIMIAIPLIISMMIAMTYLPVLKPQPFAAQGLVFEAFLTTYYTQPLLYALLYFLLDSLWGGIGAVTCLCISHSVKSRFAVITLPFAVYLLGGSLLEQVNFTQISIYAMVNPLQDTPVNEPLLLLTPVIGIVVTYYWFCVKMNKEDILH